MCDVEGLIRLYELVLCEACVCLRAPVFPLWDVWRFDSYVPHFRVAQRFSNCAV